MAMNAASNLAQSAMGALPTQTNIQPATEATETMRALEWHGKFSLKMATVPKPRVTDPEDVILRVTGTTVCGSDLHLYHGDLIQLKSGDILGHEPCGIVESVGSAVKHFKAGDRVVSVFSVACGQCEYCEKKQFTACNKTNDSAVQEKLYGDRNAGIIGYGHFVGGYAGGQAEYVRIPFGDVSLFHIPHGVSDEKALFVSDIACTSLHSIRVIDVKKKETVGVWGAGPVGLFICQWLRHIGVARIIVVDDVAERLRFVEKTYGAETVDFSHYTEVSQRVRELVPEGLDAAIDAAGFRFAKSIPHKVMRATGLETDSPEVLNECIHSVKKFGRISIIADYAAYTNGFLIGGIMEKGISLVGAGQCPAQRYAKEVLNLIKDGKFDPTTILTHRFTLEDLPEVYAAFDEKRDGMMKVFIETKFSGPPDPNTPKLSAVPKKE